MPADLGLQLLARLLVEYGPQSLGPVLFNGPTQTVYWLIPPGHSDAWTRIHPDIRLITDGPLAMPNPDQRDETPPTGPVGWAHWPPVTGTAHPAPTDPDRPGTANTPAALVTHAP